MNNATLFIVQGQDGEYVAHTRVRDIAMDHARRRSYNRGHASVRELQNDEVTHFTLGRVVDVYRSTKTKRSV